MNTNLQGKCNCGNISYKLSAALLLTYVCHCENCQKRSGSAFGMGLVVATSYVQPDLHIWTSRAQAWVTIPANVLQYEEQPEDFAEAFKVAAANRISR